MVRKFNSFYAAEKNTHKVNFEVLIPLNFNRDFLKDFRR